MELDDIKCYVKKYSEAYLYLSGIKSLSWMYIFIGLIPFAYGIITSKFVVASIVVAMVIFYTVTSNLLERNMISVSYYQRFLLSGSLSLFTSLFFLIMAYSLVETVIPNGTAQILCSLVLGLVWILAVFLIFSFKIYNIKKGRYSKNKERTKNRAGIAIASSIGAVSGISIMKFASDWMTQGIAINVAIGLLLVVAVLAAFGIPHFLAAYYVKKYSISGESLPVIRTVREKMSVRKRILIICLITFAAAIIIMTILGVLVNKGILK